MLVFPAVVSLAVMIMMIAAHLGVKGQTAGQKRIHRVVCIA